MSENMTLTCPVCYRRMHVVCGDPACTCRTWIPSGELPMVISHDGEVEACPYCGYSQHIDFWFERNLAEADLFRYLQVTA